MSESSYLYPSTPANVPPAITEPSVAFKTEVKKVLGSIILFFVVYLVLFILSIGLVIGCVYAGLAIIMNVGHIAAILAGVGLIGLGVLVFIFLIKFLFAVNKHDRSNSVEITAEDQPELFAFIRQVTTDTQTPFPKRIYLTPDVNASVFYDSGFWSMFLPVKKNLQIGLGLVNAVNLSEFKAVIAHEFGHFSQRSMKLGSFVYNVNKVIYNMLYENTGYSNFLGSWASVSDVFAIFAKITVKIAQGIQWILQQVYRVVNKNYLSLSRQMEFHADAVAASVSGSNSLVMALQRIELASAGYNLALQKCDDLFKQKMISTNIYHNHKTVLKHLAKEFSLVEENGLPVVSDEFLKNNNTSRVNFRDQWASHPTTEERKQHLQELAIPAEIVTEPAWILFRQREEWQFRLTQKVYEHLQIGKDISTIDHQVFEQKYIDDASNWELPKEFKGFYDSRQITILSEEDMLALSSERSALKFDDIFSLDNAGIGKKIRSNQSDIEILNGIAQKTIDTKTFDFDGVKYKRGEAPVIAEKLANEVSELLHELQALDKKAIAFFLTCAGEHGDAAKQQLLGDYQDYFRLRRKADEYLDMMNQLFNNLAPIYAGQSIPVEEINKIIAGHKANGEAALKKGMQEWLDIGIFQADIAAGTRCEKFIKSNYEYFSGTSFFDNELLELNEICNESWAVVNQHLFATFKRILGRQLAMVTASSIIKVEA